MAVKLEQPDLAQHHADLTAQLRKFWRESQLCDVTLRSRDGIEHRAHIAVLSASSNFFKTLLSGSFLEGDQVQRGQPVEIAASDAAVFALLEYVYGGQPEVSVDDSTELLRLADAYELPKLAEASEKGLRAALDKAPVANALKVLQETQGLPDLKATCEDKVAAHFEASVQQPDFLKLGATQLAQILEREDLQVSREEVVVDAIFKWFNHSNESGGVLGLLLRDVDFPSISSDNLSRIGQLASSFGPKGDYLQQKVDEAFRANKKRSRDDASDDFRPKRRCFQHWSPDLGASCEASCRSITFAGLCDDLCWYEGALYATDRRGIISWRPGDADSRVFCASDLSPDCSLSISPTGDMFVTACAGKLFSFRNGSGKLVLGDIEGLEAVVCSPNGAVYLLTNLGRAVQKLNGSTLQPVIESESLPAEMQFTASYMFVTQEEVVYLSDCSNSRVLRFSPGDAQPTIVGEFPKQGPNVGAEPNLHGLCVTEGGKIYVADYEGRKLWAFHPGDTTCHEALKFPPGEHPVSVVVHERLLFVSTIHDDYHRVIYQWVLPAELQLECNNSTDDNGTQSRLGSLSAFLPERNGFVCRIGSVSSLEIMLVRFCHESLSLP